jgi:hypothetical protein
MHGLPAVRFDAIGERPIGPVDSRWMSCGNALNKSSHRGERAGVVNGGTNCRRRWPVIERQLPLLPSRGDSPRSGWRGGF